MMEAQGGAEVRRLHIVYFLSRKGRIEHPHLIRVHHLSRNGVRLRDVKRWLGELRGKDIPESFCWSYKRRYKTGYVWQDLLDDDLITPISDNEYVLKGSEISSTNIKEEKVGKQKDAAASQQEHKALSKEENHNHSSEIEEESPSFGSETSTLTDDSGRVEVENNSDTTKHEKPACKDKTEHSLPFYAMFLNKKSKIRSKNIINVDEKITTPAAAVDSCKISTSEQPQCTKSKNNSNSASKMLKNLISCGDVETNDSTVVQMKKQNKPFLSMCSSDAEHVNSAAICKKDVFGGSQRISGNPTWTQQQFSRRRSFDGIENLRKNKSKSTSCAAYKPVNGPNCSQCGKSFKPEKMHAHMKSCKGMKALSKCAANAAAADKASKGTNEFKNGESFSGPLLTH
ncbi:UPSTREAM OF FLC protein [Perilla frutescens var. hirtella]|nr:UPSTREAM OF FLC protein [Perilla frutescens var. frutescens]KAH6793764.1 UPSTREAM OF FLC protein [Perilla frutescens var. hirtella]